MSLESKANEIPHTWEGSTMSFGERIRKIRTEQGLTAKDLSTASGVPEKTIYRIETGEVSDPRLSTIEPLVKALNCSADELIFDAQSFTKLGSLRQLFLKFGDLEEPNQDLLLQMIQKVLLGMSMERMVSDTLARGDYHFEPLKEE